MKLNIVPARTGIQWVRLGIRTFFRQPLALAGLFFMYMAVALVMQAIPFVGPVVVAVLMPAAILGMLVAAEHAAQGRFPMPSVLLSAFRAGKPKARSMVLLGVIYAGVMVVITLLGALAFAGDAGAPAAPGPDGMPQVQMRPIVLFALALELPLGVLFSHAPALVYWHGLSPVKSLFFSAVAFWRNLGAYLIFAATWVLVLALTGVVMSIIFAAFGAASTAFVWPIALLVITMMATSMYFPFRDCFVPTPEEPVQPATT